MALGAHQAGPWIDERLAAAGIEREGEEKQARVRPWATVLEVPTRAGPVWFKAAGAETAFEVPLYALLERVAPERVLVPLAVDIDRGWLLLPDGGPTLGETLSGHGLGSAMAGALQRYGRLQRDLAPHVDELLEMGVADMRPPVMPERFDEALEVAGSYAERHGSAEDRSTHERVAALRESFAAWCEQLAAAPGAGSLDHNDLHPWNILAGAGGQTKFYDWGDAVLAHPFASMLVPLGWFPGQLGIGRGEPLFLRARDAYLEAFSDLAPHADLVETLELACRVAKAARALTWARAVRGVAADGGEHADAPLRCLQSLLDGTYLGGM